MNKFKKLTFWSAGGLGLLLAVSAILLPRLIRLDSIKEMILADISVAMGCQTSCKNIEVLFFPRPHVVLHEATLAACGKFSGTIGSIKAYPRIMPLFLGKGRLSRLYLNEPRINIVIPQIARTRDEENLKKPFSLGELEQKLASLLAPLASRVPGLVAVIDKGILELTDEDDNLFRFQNLMGRMELRASLLKVELACESSLWKSLTVNAWLDPWKFSSEGRVILTDFKPGPLAGYLFPASTRTIGQSQFNLDVTFKGESFNDLQAEVHGSIPALDLQEGDPDFIIRCHALDGTVHLSTDHMAFTVSRLLLNYPQLSLTGKLLLDFSTPWASLEVESRDTDADAVRKIALDMVGQYSVVQKIFDIIRGGRVPLITYSASADTPDKLGKSEHYVIKGIMAEGKIFVPKVQLDLKDVSGEVVVADGILEGKGLVGRTASSYGRDGFLKIALVHKEGIDPPFHLDIDIDADLVELQSVLQRVVHHEPFQRELALIKNVKGRAQGKVVLGESLTAVKTRVDVREFSLSSHYQRLPYPVDLKGGPLFYESTGVAVGPVGGRMGKSWFSGASVRVNWGPESELFISTSAPASISLDEVYPWLVSLDVGKKTLKNIDSAKGLLTMEALEVKGPLRPSPDRHIRARGSVADLVVYAPALPGPVTVKSGKFDTVQDRLDLEGLQSSCSDASLLVSGSLKGYLEGVDTRNLAFQGTLGPQASQWIFDLIQLPAEFRPRPPLSLAQSRLVWDKDGTLSFAAEVALQNGPKVSLDVHRTPEELSISRLSIKDESSNAMLSVNIKKRELDLSFAGTLSNTSMDRLLAKNEILAGWVKGDFRSHIFLDQPMTSTAGGELQAAGFRYSWNLLNGPIAIENAHLAASGNRVDVKSAALEWRDSRMTLKGGVDFSAGGFQVDMDLHADKLSWEQLKQGMEKETDAKAGAGKGKKGQEREGKDKAGGKGNRKPWDGHLQGILRVKTDSFSYGKLTWAPLSAGVAFYKDRLDIDLTEANLCGISTPGTLKISSQGVQLNLRPAVVNQDLDPAVTCLFNKKELMNGTFNLSGELTTGKDSQEELAKALKGTLDFSAQKGRIYRLGLLSKIFAVLNVAEIYRGYVPDLIDEGFAYDSIKAKATFHDGRLTLSESVIDAPSMKMVWHGDVDLTRKELDLTVLIAPFRTVDRLIGHVPVLNGLLGGNLISIPVKVTGELEDPDVVPLSPSAVGSELFEYLKRTFQLPFTLLDGL